MVSVKTCGNPNKTNIAAQTLFLGASVADFNMNMGWGGNRSQLSVKLVEDDSPSCDFTRFKIDDKIPNQERGNRYDINNRSLQSQYSLYNFPRGYQIPNHYFNCASDESCYIDENGYSWNPQRNPLGDPPPSKERVVPGKLFFGWDGKYGFCSRYWLDPDPGFFGNATRISYTGSYSRLAEKLYKYDIINTPVIFRMGNTTFAGLVKSWERNYDSGGLGYNVDIESIDTILDESYVILDKFGGSIFTTVDPGADIKSPDFYGAPSIYNDGFLSKYYSGTIKQGAIHNVFNVYGFLESFGMNGFGGADKNDNGIRANHIIDALAVLTSSRSDDPSDPGSLLQHKRAFSPFGRIILKVPQTIATVDSRGTRYDGYNRITESIADIGMGFFPVSRDRFEVQRHHVVLDLSELPIMPDDYRISESVISISQLIQKITTDSGCDFHYEVVPLLYNGYPEIVIKVKTIFRSAQPNPNQIEQTIKTFENVGVPITTSRIGKEKNNNTSRTMYIGANQQRLFQAKSYRLAYTQSNYIYNSVTKQFIEFYASPQGQWQGKVKEPNVLSTRNSGLSTTAFGTILDVNQKISDKILREQKPGAVDPDWADAFLSGPSLVAGNYKKTITLGSKFAGIAATPAGGNNRFFPLFHDVVCPFFGYKAENDVQTGLTDSTANILRTIRPVWMDNWTGQILVLVDNTELPKSLKVPLYSPYAGSSYFAVSESEMRAAMAGFDSYLTYCVGKIFKPDLYAAIYNTYASLGKFNYALRGFVTHSPSVPTPPLQSVPEPPKPKPSGTDVISQSLDNNNVDLNIMSTSAGTVTGSSSVGNTFIGGANSSSMSGHIGAGSIPLAGSSIAIQSLFDIVGQLDFLKDLQSVCSFIAEIGNSFYGKKYMVRVPEVYAYQDRQFANLSVGDYAVYQGTGKIFYNYEPTNDGAWEEFSNFIDDNILVGSPAYYSLSDDSGKIKPILGYNASDSYDYFANWLCTNFTSGPIVSSTYVGNLGGFNSGGDLINSYAAGIGEVLTKCTNYNFRYPSIDVTQLSSEDFILRNSPVAHMDQHSSIRPIVSRRLYRKAEVEEKFAFLDPVNFRNPRAIVSVSSAVNLNTSSELYEQDPNSTVVATASIEDLCTYLRAVAPLGPLAISWSFVNLLLSRHTFVQNDPRLFMPAVIGDNASYHALAPKAAHPYFAGVPLKSNQFVYGPWTNYPSVDRSAIFPDTIFDRERLNAVENNIGGVKVEVDDELAPWNYGGMRFLDEAVLSRIYNELEYQQIIETATLSIPGLPIFGLASAFTYDNKSPERGQIRHNNKIMTLTESPVSYSDLSFVPNLVSQIPRIGNPTGNPILDYLPEGSVVKTPWNFKILKLRDTDASLVAPIITNISCSISPQSVQTTYSFRTYIQKLGFFNKEYNDRLKKSALLNIKRNKQLSDISKSFTNKIIQDIEKVKDSKSQVGALNSVNTGFFGTSPTEMIIGASFPFMETPIDYSRLINNILLGRPQDFGAYDISTGVDPGEQEIFNKFEKGDVVNAILDTKKYRSYVGEFMPKEAVGALKDHYGSKSAMSMDGLLSPVSFYPTLSNSTFSLRKYNTKLCSSCKGLGYIDIVSTLYRRQATPENYPLRIKCPSCSVKTESYSSSVTSSAATNETLPPYVITNETDFNTILQFNTSSGGSFTPTENDGTKAAGVNISIDKITLQPIVVPYGEFKNYNVQEDDRCRHSIRVVGRGEIAPTKGLSLDIDFNKNKYYDQNGTLLNFEQAKTLGHNVDYYGIDIMAKNFRGNTDRFPYLMNQRFFGFRGPMVMHGWGYDMQGYPVPNESDEPKLVDFYGRPARFLLKIENLGKVQYKQLNNGDKFSLKQPPAAAADFNEFLYYSKRDGLQIFDDREEKEGEEAGTKDDWFTPEDTLEVYKIKLDNDLDNTPNYEDQIEPSQDNPNPPEEIGKMAHLNPGDIITKQYKYSGSKWVKQARSSKFLKNWAERSDTWPVGPVDLRWDGARGVWTMKAASAPYKMVYVTLEEDLVKEDDFDETYPARGYLDDIEYSKNPLPNGFRRLVYVKDKTGFTAPKGIKLLCRYDIDNGYYEPVSKPAIIANGKISYGNTVLIDMHYSKGQNAGVIPQLTTTFKNPLGFDVSSGMKGIFTYINGEWTLTSVKN